MVMPKTAVYLLEMGLQQVSKRHKQGSFASSLTSPSNLRSNRFNVHWDLLGAGYPRRGSTYSFSGAEARLDKRNANQSFESLPNKLPPGSATNGKSTNPARPVSVAGNRNSCNP